MKHSVHKKAMELISSFLEEIHMSCSFRQCTLKSLSYLKVLLPLSSMPAWMMRFHHCRLCVSVQTYQT